MAIHAGMGVQELKFTRYGTFHPCRGMWNKFERCMHSNPSQVGDKCIDHFDDFEECLKFKRSMPYVRRAGMIYDEWSKRRDVPLLEWLHKVRSETWANEEWRKGR